MARYRARHSKQCDARRIRGTDAVTFLFIVLLLASIIARVFFVQPVRVEGTSMVPNYQDGQLLLARSVRLGGYTPVRFDVVVVESDYGVDPLIKRVIGLPGETVEITDGVVYVDGEPLDDSTYVYEDATYEMDALIVPDDCIFVLGDNRNGSIDSHSALVGCLSIDGVRAVI